MRKHKLFAVSLAAVMCLSIGSLTAFSEDNSGADASVTPDPVVSEDPAPVTPDPVVPDPVVPDPPAVSTDTSEISYDPGYDGEQGGSGGGGYSDGTSEYTDDGPTYYYDSDGNSYTDQNEVYVGGGQTYEPPAATAPSAALYKTDGKVDENTMSEGDWGDIARRLKNSDGSNDDGAADFAAIQNNTASGDNGHWMIIAGIACLLLSLTGFVYFIVSGIMRRRALKAPVQAASASQPRYRANDDYDDGFKSEPKPKKTSGKGGRRYK